MNNKRKDKGKVCVLVVMGDHRPSRPGDFTNYGKDTLATETAPEARSRPDHPNT